MTTIKRRFLFILFLFISIEAISITSVLSFVPVTHNSSIVLSKESGFVENHYYLLEKHIKSETVINSTITTLRENDVVVSFSELLEGIFFQKYYSELTDITLGFSSSNDSIVETIVITLASEGIDYIKTKTDEDSKRIFVTLYISEPPSKVSRSDKQFLFISYCVYFGMFLSILIPLLYGYASDRLYNQKDIKLLGNEAFEINIKYVDCNKKCNDTKFNEGVTKEILDI